MRRPSLRHRLEYLAVRLGWGLCRALGPDRASAWGGRLARLLGPLLPAHRTARVNLELALGPLEPARRRAILRGMWDNLGRVAAEYPHLAEIGAGRVTVVGGETHEGMRTDGRAGLMFSAHFGNWELLTISAARLGLPLVAVYRPMNNPLVDRLMRRLRAVGEGELVAKWGGGRRLLKALKDGRHVAMLVDQKASDGIPVPFFGKDAMTTPAVAVLALALGCPVVPARVERVAGVRFALHIEPPVEIECSGEREADVQALTLAINRRIEDWIRARPEQWFWVHRRFPAATYGDRRRRK